MNIITTLLIAAGLAMDAFAASLASGMSLQKERIFGALRIALFFGLFQGFMPVLGWLIAFRLHGIVTHVDHWIAFVLLVFIGCKMIIESMRKKQSTLGDKPPGTAALLALSIATSIDAFAVGISFAFLGIHIVVPVMIIGLVTFALSLVGVLIAGCIGALVGNRIGILGGVILMGIGAKILLDHMKW